MILPESNNKKYIKTVIGIFILFTIISPVVSKFIDNDFNIENVFSLDTYKNQETLTAMSSNLVENNEKNINDIYVNALREDISTKLTNKGYIVEKIDIDIELENQDEYGQINELQLIINKKDVGKSAESTRTEITNKIK